MRRTSLFIVAAVAVLLTIALYCLLEPDTGKYRVSIRSGYPDREFIWVDPTSWWPSLTQPRPKAFLSGPVALDVPFICRANNGSFFSITGKLHREANGLLHFVGQIPETWDGRVHPIELTLRAGSKQVIAIKLNMPPSGSTFGSGEAHYAIQFDPDN